MPGSESSTDIDSLESVYDEHVEYPDISEDDIHEHQSWLHVRFRSVRDIRNVPFIYTGLLIIRVIGLVYDYDTLKECNYTLWYYGLALAITHLLFIMVWYMEDEDTLIRNGVIIFALLVWTYISIMVLINMHNEQCAKKTITFIMCLFSACLLSVVIFIIISSRIIRAVIVY
jgi:hypothetical protein